MYEIECLTNAEHVSTVNVDTCSPFYGECYPVAEGCCGPDCDPTVGYCGPDVCSPDGGNR